MLITLMIKLLFTLIFSTNLFAITFELSHPCDNKSEVYQVNLANLSNVGEVTIKILSKENIPFIGTEAGINSILNTPTGMDAYDIEDNHTMYAYGWCYKVNDLEPSAYPNEYIVSDNDHVFWWFGYATYKNGKWITQCEPSSTRRLSSFCSSD